MQREHSIWMEAISSYARVCARSIFLQITLISLFFFVPAFGAPLSLNDFKLMTSTTTGICLPAIERLGQSRDRSAAPVLIRALGKEKRPVVRRYLVEALGLLRDASAAPALMATLQDADAQVRQSAVISLEQVGGDEAQDALMARADQEHDAGTKMRLIAHLGRSRHPQAADHLTLLAADSDPAIRAAAEKALKNKKVRREGHD